MRQLKRTKYQVTQSQTNSSHHMRVDVGRGKHTNHAKKTLTTHIYKDRLLIALLATKLDKGEARLELDLAEDQRYFSGWLGFQHID